MELDLASVSDGTIQASRNISDSLWTNAADQAQILTWVKARGFDHYVYPSSSPSLGADITNMDSVHAWIQSSYDENWGAKATGPAPITPPAATSSSGLATVGVIAAVGAVVWFLWR